MWDELKHKLSNVAANGVELRACVTGDGPLVILIHGWPEGWYSWRHQIEPLALQGFKVVALDVRGYGLSGWPNDIDFYSMRNMVGDIVAVIDTFNAAQAIVIGHDWGAYIAWYSALLAPDRIAAVAGLSVPFTGRAPMPPLDLWRSIYRDKFFYQLSFLEPGRAESDFSKDIRGALAKIYGAWRGGSKGVSLMAEASQDASLLDLMDDVDTLPDWLPEEDLDYMAAQFAVSGFHGGFNRYRVQNKDWSDLEEIQGKTIDQPSFFVVGKGDPVLAMVPGVDMIEVQKRYLTDCRGVHIIDGAGHWVQQQKPTEVSQLLAQFCQEI